MLKCEGCKQEFPSEYYFKTDTICVECFYKLNPEEQKMAKIKSLMKYPLSSTTQFIEGYNIKKHLGVVRGITVRSRSVFGRLGAEIQTIFGGKITLFTELCEQTRHEAFDMMFKHAHDIGANAVIGIRYDATEVTEGVTEVLCYGTAVIVESEDNK